MVTNPIFFSVEVFVPANKGPAKLIGRVVVPVDLKLPVKRTRKIPIWFVRGIVSEVRARLLRGSYRGIDWMRE